MDFGRTIENTRMDVQIKNAHFRRLIRRTISAGRIYLCVKKQIASQPGSFVSLYGVRRDISGSQINPIRIAFKVSLYTRYRRDGCARR